MTPQPADAFELLRKIRYDLTAAQAKVTDALKVLAALNLPDQPEWTCDGCGLNFRGRNSLAEHVYHSHDGPVPEHWARIEAMSVEPPTADLERSSLESATESGGVSGG